jgi:hypothetical protein
MNRIRSCARSPDAYYKSAAAIAVWGFDDARYPAEINPSKATGPVICHVRFSFQARPAIHQASKPDKC